MVAEQQPRHHLSLTPMPATGDTLLLSHEQLAKHPDSLLIMMAGDVGGDTLDVPDDDAHRFRLVGGVYRCGPPACWGAEVQGSDLGKVCVSAVALNYIDRSGRNRCVPPTCWGSGVQGADR